MAKLSKPPIPYKVYERFALVTLVGTLALAMLTDGGPDAASGNPGAQPSATATRTIGPGERAKPAYGEARLVQQGQIGSFGSEAGPSGGSGDGGGSGGGRSTGFITLASGPVAGSENAAFTAAYLNSLSDEELAALLRSLEEGGIESDAEMRQAAALIEASSRRRSGHRISQE